MPRPQNIGIDDQRRAKIWHEQLQKHRQFLRVNNEQALAEFETGEKIVSKGSENNFYVIQFKNLAGLEIPPQVQYTLNRDFTYRLQAMVSFFSYKQGFFGRTYAGQLVPIHPETLNMDRNNDWAFLYTKINDPDVYLVVEYVLDVAKINRQEANKAMPYKRYGIGFTLVPLENQMMNATSATLYRGTPRLLMAGKRPEDLLDTNCRLDYELQTNQMQFRQMTTLISQDCIVGPNDMIPGLKRNNMPRDGPHAFHSTESFSGCVTLFCHEPTLEAIDSLEEAFGTYLRAQRVADEFGSASAAASVMAEAKVVERRLTAVPHNTWRQFRQPSIVSLAKDAQGRIRPSGMLKVLDFAVHAQVALVFRIEYKVLFKTAEGQARHQEFVLGWASYLPTLAPGNASVEEQPVRLTFQLGGTSPTGEIQWDRNLVRAGAPDLAVQLTTTLSTFEEMAQTAPGTTDDASQAELDKMRSELERAAERQKREESRVKKVQEQNDQLRREKDDLERRNRDPVIDTVNNTQEQKEIARAKEYYLHKNLEIEQLIKQVMTGDSGKAPRTEQRTPRNLATTLLEQKPDSVESLLKFLIYLVLSKEQVSEQDQSRQEQTKKSLLDLLKSDENLRTSMLGHFQQMQAGPQQTPMHQDDILALRNMLGGQGFVSMGGNTRDPLAEAQLLEQDVNMELELNDVLKASNISLKFVSFKTPSSWPGGDAPALPSRVFFTFKFYNFDTVETNPVYLRQASDLENDEIGRDPEMKLATQYYLIQDFGRQIFDRTKPMLEQVIDRGLTQNFNVDPNSGRDRNAHENLVKYLKNGVLSIQMFDARSHHQPYGFCKIPLYKFMRQGKPSKVLAQSFDVYEYKINAWVGSLELLVRNEGHKVGQGNDQFIDDDFSRLPADMRPASLPSVQQTTIRKKVYSKPMDALDRKGEQPLMSDLKDQATRYDYGSQQLRPLDHALSNAQSEESRKRLRVQRLQMQQVQKGVSSHDFDPTALYDPESKISEQKKRETLKHIQMVREMKKNKMMYAFQKGSETQ